VATALRESTGESRARRRVALAEALAGAALLAAAFAASLLLYTRHADMPYYYHSDEPSKVEQVTGARPLNFKHPLLLMNATRGLARATAADGDRQAAVRAGRLVSAAFAALAVAVLAALAWLERGLLAAACVAVVVGLSHGLFTFSHFMKEDTALVFGLAAAALGASRLAHRRSAASAAAFGVGCGLALSAKYAGAVALAGAPPLLWLALRGAPRPGPLRGLGAWLAGLLSCLALVNVSVLLDPAAFRAGLAYEANHATTGGGRPFAGLLSPAYLHALVVQTTWPVRLLGLGGLAFALATWRRRTLSERALVLFPLAYLAVLQLSPIKATRYLLPFVVAVHAFAGVALPGLAAALAARVPALRAPGRRAALTLALLAAVALVEARAVALHLREFAAESRTALYAFVRANVPPESAILQDRYAGLPDPILAYRTPAQPYLDTWVLTRHYAVDYGSYDDVVAAGIEYVAVCDRTYGRFFGAPRRFDSDATRERFERRRARYAELFERGELVFEAGTSRVTGVAVNPVVRVYRVGGAPGTGEGSR
jgi:hypothetical protein